MGFFNSNIDIHALNTISKSGPFKQREGSGNVGSIYPNIVLVELLSKLSNSTVLNCPLILWLMESSGKPLLVLELENGSSTQLHSLKLSRIEEA